jgi:hypothetical protein
MGRVRIAVGSAAIARVRRDQRLEAREERDIWFSSFRTRRTAGARGV